MGFFCAKNKSQHFLNSLASSPFSLILFAGPGTCLIKGVKFLKVPKLSQYPQGLSGGKNDLRLRVYAARWHGSANTEHLTLEV